MMTEDHSTEARLTSLGRHWEAVATDITDTTVQVELLKRIGGDQNIVQAIRLESKLEYLKELWEELRFQLDMLLNPGPVNELE